MICIALIGVASLFTFAGCGQETTNEQTSDGVISEETQMENTTGMRDGDAKMQRIQQMADELGISVEELEQQLGKGQHR